MLNRSIRRGLLKSCPNCSVLCGQLVFKSLDAFGWRCNGRYIQSWCEDCRA